MMKIVSVNCCNFGSTGGIVGGISKAAESKGMIYYQAYPWAAANRPPQKNDILIGNKWGKVTSVAMGRLTGMGGCFSRIATKRFLRKLDDIKPDILHLHNLHDSYVNLPSLFDHIKKNKIKVVWTLHDCWAFTGKCPHFVTEGCEKWREGCHDCPKYREYPKAYVDRTRYMWKLKKRLFTGVSNLTIVTPSLWLANLVKESFLEAYPVKVIHNGIDLDVFKPTEGKFREERGLTDKYIVLGVAMYWSDKKGLDVFIKMSEHLPDNYRIVLVGTDDDTGKKLPDNVISVHGTLDKKEMAQIYTAADVFVNPTKEEVLGLVNLEALACGIPVITFRTGGSPECIDERSGIVVEYNDTESMRREVMRVCETKCFTKEACMARAGLFDARERFKEYTDLYESI